MIKTITERLDRFSLNTVISGFMEFNNELTDLNKKQSGLDKDVLTTYSILLAPFAPHVAEEIYNMLGNTGSVFNATWPTYDPEKAKSSTIHLPIQVNGKTKGFIDIEVDLDEKEVIALAKQEIENKINGNIIKEIYVKNKIINLVVK